MNERNYGEQEYFQDNYRNVITNPLKNNEIKYKKRNILIDREQLYSQNLQLKSTVKELMELNLKMKTQLSIAQKQKLNLCSMAEEENIHPKIAPRSQSGNHKKLMINAPNQNQPIHFGSSLAKEKQALAFKKIIRDQTLQIEKLNAENQKIKKAMKYTRMNEIMVESKELLDETIRLKAIINETRQVQNQTYVDYANQIDNLKRKLIQQRQGEKRNGYELKKQTDFMIQLKEKLRQSQLKKTQLEKRLTKQIKQLKSEVTQSKSKLIEQQASLNRTGKDCDKQDCIKNLKQRNDFKKKIELLQRQSKKLKEQNQNVKRKSFQLEFDSRKNNESTSKKNEKVSDRANNQSNLVNKQESKNHQPLVEHKHVSQQKIEEKSKSQINFMNIELLKEQSPQVAQKEYKSISKKENSDLKPVDKQSIQESADKKKKKISEHQQSEDTQKLLESDHLKVQSKQNIKSETKDNQKQHKKKIEAAQEQQKYNQQSQGQYQALDYEQQEETQKNKKPVKKDSSKKQVITPQKEEKPKKKSTKPKEKQSKKNIAKNQSEDEQVLYRSEDKTGNLKSKQQNDDIKLELKLVKQTLLYKFMAQRYTYDDFCNDIEGSDIKNFAIAEIMNLLTEEPFLLNENDIEIIIIYLFEKSQLTGHETILTKNFIKKMKKFIGKAKVGDQQTDQKNINHIGQIIMKDETESQKIRHKFMELDSGEGFISKQAFIKVMSQFGIKGQYLETAIAQIVYVSPDITHLNYDFFLKRFTSQMQ